MAGKVTLKSGRERSLLRRHPWIFAGAIEKVEGKFRSGDTVEVFDAAGKWLARGAFSPASSIRVRIWSFEQEEVIDNAFFLRRIETAWRGRTALLQRTNACRLVAAESDGLPGVTIDLYDRLLVCQLLSAGADRHRDKIVWALQKLFPDHAILERSDVQIRAKEGLPLVTQVLQGEVPNQVLFREGDCKFQVDPWHGHKTGFYLDQRRNREIVASYAGGRDVLNCFSYTGAMAVYCLRGGATAVTNLDVSEPALELARTHLELNHIDPGRCMQMIADVFTQLRSFRDQGRKFDLVILDPPKFVDSKHNLTQACRGYKDINMLAMQLLQADGILATFSCSGLMPEDLFHKVVADAALDAGREVQYLRKLSQDEDHPVLSTYPEGYYLKGLICRVV